ENGAKVQRVGPRQREQPAVYLHVAVLPIAHLRTPGSIFCTARKRLEAAVAHSHNLRTARPVAAAPRIAAAIHFSSHAAPKARAAKTITSATPNIEIDGHRRYLIICLPLPCSSSAIRMRIEPSTPPRI